MKEQNGQGTDKERIDEAGQGYGEGGAGVQLPSTRGPRAPVHAGTFAGMPLR